MQAFHAASRAQPLCLEAQWPERRQGLEPGPENLSLVALVHELTAAPSDENSAHAVGYSAQRQSLVDQHECLGFGRPQQAVHLMCEHCARQICL